MNLVGQLLFLTPDLMSTLQRSNYQLEIDPPSDAQNEKEDPNFND
ncbi:unnamed protein product, partial [Allacma fusca]